jgi:hypothetical protein
MRATATNPPSKTAIYSAIVATLALVGTIWTFYYTEFRTVTPIIEASGLISLLYNSENGLSLSVPITFANTGAQPRIIRRLELRMRDLNDNNETTLPAVYYATLQWSETRQESIWSDAEYVSPIALKKDDNVAKTIIFYSAANMRQTRPWSSHNYQVNLIAYVEDNKPQSFDEFHFTPSPEMTKALQEAELNRTFGLFTTESGIAKSVFDYSVPPPPLPPPTPSPGSIPSKP